MTSAAAYHYGQAGLLAHHDYLMPTVRRVLEERRAKTVFELGCGNGAVAAQLHLAGYGVIGVDPSADGITIARQQHPHLQLHQGASDEPLRETYGQFDAVLSLEVIEHVYDPHTYAQAVFDLTKPGGIAIISTPYHGPIKNTLIAVTPGGWDKHHNPLWRHGHIKFWSIPTLRQLLLGAGFSKVNFERVGRPIPWLAKSMIAVATK